jgi:FdhD protein
VQLVHEGIDRHNALDKLVGATRRVGRAAGRRLRLDTSRASFERVRKSAMAGVGALAAVSAPTALAVDTPRARGVAPAGFVRDDDLEAYTFAEHFGLRVPSETSAATWTFTNSC